MDVGSFGYIFLMTKSDMKSRKIFLISFFLVLLIATGFLREQLFRSINYIILYRDVNPFILGKSFITDWMNGFSNHDLLLLKWILTFVFSFAFLIYTISLSKIIFPKSSFTRFILFIYAAGIFISCAAILLGIIIPTINGKTYYFARLIMGAEQSPLLSGIIIMALKAFDSIENNSTKNFNQKLE